MVAFVLVTLTDKVALITGGKRIGLVVARELAARGVDIASSYARSKTEADQLAGEVRAAHRRAAVFQADLSQPSAAAALVQSVVDTLGRLDILINMASIYEQKAFAESLCHEGSYRQASVGHEKAASTHCEGRHVCGSVRRTLRNGLR